MIITLATLSFIHLYQPLGETIFDADGCVQTCMKEARKRGVIFDTGNARVYWSFDNLSQAFDDGFYPDVISTDLVNFSIFTPPVCSLSHTMAIYSAAGMDELAIFKAVTQTPASALNILERAGTLKAGRPANIAVFDVTPHTKNISDFFGGHRPGNKMFVPLLTMKDGKTVYRQVFFQ